MTLPSGLAKNHQGLGIGVNRDMHFPADANISRILEDLVVVSIIFSNYRYQTIDYDICKKICAVQQGVPSADNSSV